MKENFQLLQFIIFNVLVSKLGHEASSYHTAFKYYNLKPLTFIVLRKNTVFGTVLLTLDCNLIFKNVSFILYVYFIDPQEAMR